MNSPRRVRSVILFVIMLLPGASLMAQGTLERIAKRNEFRIGYRTDARPLSFEQNGEAAGYSVDICRRIATSVKEHLKKADLKITFVAVTSDNRLDAVAKGDVDIECGATTITLGRQERVDFSLMTFVTGGSLLSMAEKRIGTVAELSGKRVAVIRGTTTNAALDAHLKKNLIDARIVQVADRDEGMTKLRSGDVDAFASDQIVLMGEAMKALEQDRQASFSFADELFSYEPYALVVQRNDADFRLVVNRAIVQLFRGGQYAQLFQTWVGIAGVKPSPMLQAMYQIQTVSD